MLLIDFGKTIDDKATSPEKQFVGISVNDVRGSKVTVLRAVHPLNTEDPNVLRDCGKLISNNDVQFKNTFKEIVSIDEFSSNTTLTKLLHPSKADELMVFTVLGIVIFIKSVLFFYRRYFSCK